MVEVSGRLQDAGPGDVPGINPSLGLALQALSGTALPWVLLRGEDNLARPTGDVDVLVCPELLIGLDDLLEGVGFRRLLARGHGSHRFYFRHCETNNIWIKLDIVSDVSFGKLQQLETPLAVGCLRRRVATGPVWLPAPRDKAWLLLLHLVLDKGEVPPTRTPSAKAAAVVATAADPVARFLDRRLGLGTAEQVLDVMRTGGFDHVAAMAATMSSKWAGAPAGPWLKGVRNRVLRRVSPRLRGRGLVVGALAPDGAGKTTLLHGLQKDFPLPTAYVYMGLWGFSRWDPWLRRIPGGRLGKKMFRVLRGGLIARYHALRGRIVLLDRVAYDALLPGGGAADRLGKFTDGLALRVGPEPDVLLVLDAPGDLMFARKGEHSPEILETWRDSYLDLAAKLGSAWVVDASRPQDVVRRQATEIIWAGKRRRQKEGPLGSGALPLQLWSLLDWRFLLPVLQPVNLGYGGRISKDAMAAIRLLQPDAVEVAPRRPPCPSRTFDVVWLSEPDLELLESAASSIRSGGWVCAQLRRSLLKSSGPRTLAGWKRAFVQMGLTDVSVYWHAPTLDESSRVVPTASATAVRDTLSRHEGIRFGKAKAGIGRLALALSLFDVAIPEGTVTGRLPEQGAQQAGHPR